MPVLAGGGGGWAVDVCVWKEELRVVTLRVQHHNLCIFCEKETKKKEVEVGDAVKQREEKKKKTKRKI